MNYTLKLQGGPLDGLEEQYACEGDMPCQLRFPADLGEPHGSAVRQIVVYGWHSCYKWHSSDFKHSRVVEHTYRFLYYDNPAVRIPE